MAWLALLVMPTRTGLSGTEKAAWIFTAMIDIKKSSRHSKIAGTFGESLLLYWLSKHGFECASVDHTGIDLLARNPVTNELMGISVKSRTRTPGTEAEHVSIPIGNFAKTLRACEAFGCAPYFAIVCDAANVIRVFIASLMTVQRLSPPGERVSAWKMTPAALDDYYADPGVMIFEMKTRHHRWWQSSSAPLDPP
jgi:hypothetical protein